MNNHYSPLYGPEHQAQHEERADRFALESELDSLQRKCEAADIINPAWMRRIDAIKSLLLTDGDSADVSFSSSKPRGSNRVTSFTKDRR